MATVERTRQAPSSPEYRADVQSAASGSRVMRVLSIPAVDKTVAIVATLPLVYSLARRLTAGTLTLPQACSATALLVTIVTMVLRRAPRRVTPNPLWWLLAFVFTYGGLAWATFPRAGQPAAPIAVIDVLAVVSLAVVLYARLSLGRNIGFVPAQRRIVQSGAYGYVRHPIYSGLFLAWLALALRFFSAANVAIFLTQCALMVIKSLVEENFLAKDPEYAEYMRRVRHRYVPGVV